MNEQIIKEISNDLNIKEKQVEVTLTLLKEGNTVPFISRYRKEATGALDEEQIRKINVFRRRRDKSSAGVLFFWERENDDKKYNF